MAQVTPSRSKRLPLAIALALVVAGAANTTFAQDATGLDQQAREAAWAGRTPEALQLMDQHLAQHPDDQVARLDRARFLAWSGNYAAAIETLDALGGDDDEARALRARVMAWAGRRDAALALNAPLYQAAPEDYDNAWTQTLAAHLGEWPHEALPPLATVQRLKPDTKDTLDLVKVVRLPLFSWVGVPGSVYEDSDDIQIRSIGVEANVRVSDRWRLLADASRREHSAPVSGPFAPVQGGDSVDESRGGIGVRYAASPDSTLEFWLGRSELDFDNGGGSDGATIGRMAFAHRVSDGFAFTLAADRDRVIASPRAVSLGTLRTGISADLRWTPTLRDTVSARIAFDDLNDDNKRHAASVDYRHAIYRGMRANVDFGGQAEWFGYSRNPGNGYYSPDRYLRVAPLISSYIKLDDEAALYLQATVGVQRDDTFDSWKRASDVSAALTVGVFTNWQLVATAGYSERLNEFGQYNGTSVGLQLRYRFCEFSADRCPGGR